MSEPFLAEIRMVGFNFAPRGWAFCDGQILPINQNQSLYSLLGTTYGGDGRTSFSLPDMRGRTALHVGTSEDGTDYSQGQKSGAETHTLSAGEMPQHNHVMMATSNQADQFDSNNRVLANTTTNAYSANATTTQLAADTVTNMGGGQAHGNMQPYCTINFCIALQGLFPSRN